MADVNLQLVREFFELNIFRVLTNWDQEPWREHAGERSPQLFVENPQPRISEEVPVVLRPADLVAIERAVVHIRAWHADRFYPSVIESSPVLSRFEADEASSLARVVFAHQPFVTILVISELPVSPELRSRSLSMLQQAGVDHVIEFPQILKDLLDRVSIEGNYGASVTLQMLRLLKRYKFIRNQQLEFSFVVDPPVPVVAPWVEVINEPVSDEENTPT